MGETLDRNVLCDPDVLSHVQKHMQKTCPHVWGASQEVSAGQPARALQRGKGGPVWI